MTAANFIAWMFPHHAAEKAYDEAKHRRAPKGDPRGGEWIAKMDAAGGYLPVEQYEFPQWARVMVEEAAHIAPGFENKQAPNFNKVAVQTAVDRAMVHAEKAMEELDKSEAIQKKDKFESSKRRGYARSYARDALAWAITGFQRHYMTRRDEAKGALKPFGAQVAKALALHGDARGAGFETRAGVTKLLAVARAISKRLDAEQYAVYAKRAKTKAYDEAKHRRKPKGDPKGGQWDAKSAGNVVFSSVRGLQDAITLERTSYVRPGFPRRMFKLSSLAEFDEAIQKSQEVVQSLNDAHQWWRDNQRAQGVDVSEEVREIAMQAEHWLGWLEKQRADPQLEKKMETREGRAALASYGRQIEQSFDVMLENFSNALKNRGFKSYDESKHRRAPKGAPGGGRWVDMPEIVQRALNETVTDVGQLSSQERVQLRRAVQKGVLARALDYKYPNPKPVYHASQASMDEYRRQNTEAAPPVAPVESIAPAPTITDDETFLSQLTASLHRYDDVEVRLGYPQPDTLTAIVSHHSPYPIRRLEGRLKTRQKHGGKFVLTHINPRTFTLTFQRSDIATAFASHPA